MRLSRWRGAGSTRRSSAGFLRIRSRRSRCEGRVIFQSRLGLGRPARTYLVRIVVDVDRRPAEVVTVYRTTKIAKYWRR
jgi:hypothetical protein